MPGLGGALSIAGRTLYNSQLALEVTSNNVSNANTAGYSKQTLEITANIPIQMGPGMIGTGATATQVTRAHNEFIDEQVDTKTSDYYYWQAQSDAMDEVETIFNEAEDTGLNAMMSEFWSAWSNLADNPDGTAEREALLATTENLTQAMTNIDYNLRETQRNLNSNIQGAVEEVNNITARIADLNTKITSLEVEGQVNANDLRDERDQLLTDLSEYMDISYYEEEASGQVMVYIMGGTPLVMGSNAYTLDSEYNTTTGFTDVVWQNTSGTTVNITDKLESGKIAGWINVRDNEIPSYLDSLNTMADEVVWQVNSLSADGSGLESVSSMTGTVRMSATDDLSSDFYFSDRYNDGGTFDIVTYDSSGNVAGTYTISPAGDTVQDLMDAINAVPELTASLTSDGYFNIEADTGYTFAVNPTDGEETSHALAIMGVNTFFTWSEDTSQPVDDLTQTIGVNSALTENSNLISAGNLDENSEIAPGDNTIALAVAALQDAVNSVLGNTTIDSYYGSLIAQVGVDVENVDTNATYNSTLLDQYIEKQESISGVNLDEEMVDIMQFQQLYQAAAKIISVCDEMMQSLLSIK